MIFSKKKPKGKGKGCRSVRLNAVGILILAWLLGAAAVGYFEGDTHAIQNGVKTEIAKVS